ncbi:MAG: toprim domain-containing protein [Planctomycetota bacterium]
MNEEWKKFDDRPLDVIAQDMLDWCLTHGCQKLGETDKEFQIQCPNINCSSRQKGELHKAFDINKDSAQYHCWHCGLKGVGLHGSKGLIATLESGDFSPSAFSGKQNINAEFFKPKKEIKPLMTSQEYAKLHAHGISDRAKKYLEGRGITKDIYEDFDYRICSIPKGGTLPFLDKPLKGEVIIFPNFRSKNGKKEVVSVHYRDIDNDKWYNSTGHKYIYWTKLQGDIIVLTEGIPDAFSESKAGYTGAALLGTEITYNYNLEPFRDKSVVVMLDGDKEGQDAVANVASKLVNIASEVRIATIPTEIDGHKVKDPNDVLVKAGTEKLKEIIESAKLYNAESTQNSSENAESTTEQETTMPNDATEPKTDEQQAKSSANAETQKETSPEDKPKKESTKSTLIKKINEIRASKIKVFSQRRKISKLVIDDLLLYGYFCRTPIGELFYFAKGAKELFELSDLDFHARLSRRYDMNPSEREFGFVRIELENLTRLDGKRVEVYRFTHFDIKQKVLYVYNNDHQIYRLDGNNIMLIDNGMEDVLFMKNPLAEPFEYNPDSIEKGLFKKIMVDSINFTKGESAPLQPEEQKQLHEYYLYSLFFPELLPAKPIEVLVGDKGSGKSVCQRKRGKLLYSERFNLKPIATDREDAFIATITNNHLASFDNVDSKITWLNNHLASASTGEEVSLRKLYTTNEEINYPVNCFITLNTRTPQFKRPDVVDRSLILRTETIELKKPEGEIYQEVADKRNALWSELLEKLNLVVATIQSNQEAFTTQHRMADWAKLAWNIAKAEKKETEFLSTLDRLNRAQSDFLLEDDSLFACLLVWLENPDNIGKEVASGTLYKNLQFIANQEDLDFAFKNSKTFGKHLKQIFPSIKEYLKKDFLATIGQGKKNLTICKFEKIV